MGDRASWLRAFADRRSPAEPDLDALELERLHPDAVIAARLVWRRRVVNERLSVDLARRLRLTAPEPELDLALARLEADEQRHVFLTQEVLARLGASEPEATPDLTVDEPHPVAYFRLVLTGLALSETVSAARFAVVREHTDLDTFRACIDAFFRDELAHSELGFVLLPSALEQLVMAIGKDRADALALDELRSAFAHLDEVVGLDLERRGGPPPARPQPPDNPGVIEPALDALAFYRAVHEELVPRLERAGLPAERAWRQRCAPPLLPGR